MVSLVAERLPLAADPETGARGLAEWRAAGGPVPDGHTHALLTGIFGSSPFLSDALLREVGFARGVLDNGPDATFAALLDGLRSACRPDLPSDGVMVLLREAKRRGALAVALADLSGAWDVVAATAALSWLAETCLDLAVRHLFHQACTTGALTAPPGTAPEDAAGFIVLGMGKLGARELNYSSDIDLILLYDDEVVSCPRPDRLQQTMVRIARSLVRIMEERTAAGYVFRTDLRLRPDPPATPLAMSAAAAEVYYESMGQNWERAAMLKARPVAGDLKAGETFLHHLRPYIWRRTLDFAAVRDIQSIKRQIDAHHGGGGISIAGQNVKLGRGGIREIEFFAQTQQLIWGGRSPALRQRRTLEALDALTIAGHVPPQVRDELRACYAVLRTVEHRLQMVADQQTHTLPEDPTGLAAIARFCGWADTEAFVAHMRRVFETVERHYAALFHEEAPLTAPGIGNLVFTGEEDDPGTLATLERLGFRQPSRVAATVRAWHRGRVRATRSARARELLTELMPALLVALGRTADPDHAFRRFDTFLEAQPAGVQFFALLQARPALLDFMAEVLGNAPLLAEHLARSPALLDGVISGGFDAPPPALDEMAGSLRSVVARAEDFQDCLDAVRRWTNDRRFHIGVQMLRGRLDPADAGTAFADVADAVLPAMLERVAEEFAIRHGRVPGGALALVAYGKLGSRELTPTSDLDLVPLYDAPGMAAMSDGPRPLAASTYYGRLVQRFESALSVTTGEGRLYEIDLRLRPHGIDGPLATRIETFERYVGEEAWTWELMSLIRARTVAGPPDLVARVAAARLAALTRPRDPDLLLRDVAAMRARIAETHPVRSHWAVKHQRGGLVDIEFIAQWLVLRHAPAEPGVIAADPAEAFRRLAVHGRLDRAVADDLSDLARFWRRLQATLRLMGGDDFAETTASPGARRALATAMGVVDFDALGPTIEAAAERGRAHFAALIAEPAAALAAAPVQEKA